MSDSSRTRVSVIAIAAYMVALQAVLLPLSVAAAAPFATSRCAPVSDAGNDSPVSQSVCPCASGCGMQCCAHALALPAPIVFGAAHAYAGAAAREVLLFGVVRPVTHCPQIPRAPPFA
jgi:hypothetical protein